MTFASFSRESDWDRISRLWFEVTGLLPLLATFKSTYHCFRQGVSYDYGVLFVTAVQRRPLRTSVSVTVTDKPSGSTSRTDNRYDVMVNSCPPGAHISSVTEQKHSHLVIENKQVWYEGGRYDYEAARNNLSTGDILQSYDKAPWKHPDFSELADLLKYNQIYRYSRVASVLSAMRALCRKWRKKHVMYARRYRCKHCGAEYKPARRDSKFCSGKCRVAAHRKHQEVSK